LVALKANQVTRETLNTIASKKDSETFTTPFVPKDYNRKTYTYEFASEYLGRETEEFKNPTEQAIVEKIQEIA
jgi:hypothetical protein